MRKVKGRELYCKDLGILYTEVPHVVLRNWMPVLSNIEYRALSLVVDKTFGHHVNRAAISQTYLADGAGMSKSSAKKALLQLQEMQLIRVVGRQRYGNGRGMVYEINLETLVDKAPIPPYVTDMHDIVLPPDTEKYAQEIPIKKRNRIRRLTKERERDTRASHTLSKPINIGDTAIVQARQEGTIYDDRNTLTAESNSSPAYSATDAIYADGHTSSEHNTQRSETFSLERTQTELQEMAAIHERLNQLFSTEE